MKEEISTEFGTMIAILEEDAGSWTGVFESYPLSIIVADSRQECLERLQRLANIILTAKLRGDIPEDFQ